METEKTGEVIIFRRTDMIEGLLSLGIDDGDVFELYMDESYQYYILTTYGTKLILSYADVRCCDILDGSGRIILPCKYSHKNNKIDIPDDYRANLKNNDKEYVKNRDDEFQSSKIDIGFEFTDRELYELNLNNAMNSALESNNFEVLEKLSEILNKSVDS